jgi:hypothetical protein
MSMDRTQWQFRPPADFKSYTDKNWSVQGYSSARQMRETLGNSWSAEGYLSVEQMGEALGNSQSRWLKKTDAHVQADESAAGEDSK